MTRELYYDDTLASVKYNKTLKTLLHTVPLDLNFTYARAQKATARSIHGNAPE